jgi:hypothetical protein
MSWDVESRARYRLRIIPRLLLYPYLDKRANSVQPFLFIGIISATRSILSAGAQLSISLSSSSDATVSPHFASDVVQQRHSANTARGFRIKPDT